MNKPHLEGCPNIDCHNNKDCCPFRKIVIPSVMGGDSEGEDYAPENGAYRNALVEYESNGHIYMYSSDGIPTRLTSESGTSDYMALTNKPSIEGHELVGNKTAEELGVAPSGLFYVYVKFASNPFIYKDRECTQPMTAGEVLDAYKSGARVVFSAISPIQPGQGGSYSLVCDEVTRVYEGRSSGEGGPITSIFFVINNAQIGTNTVLGKQTLLKAYSPSDTRLTSSTFIAQQELTAGHGIAISGGTISATGGATVFYADLVGVTSTLYIYRDQNRVFPVNEDAMDQALSLGPVIIRNAPSGDVVFGEDAEDGDNRTTATVVSSYSDAGDYSIVIDMCSAQGVPARRRFKYNGVAWAEYPF